MAASRRADRKCPAWLLLHEQCATGTPTTREALLAAPPVPPRDARWWSEVRPPPRPWAAAALSPVQYRSPKPSHGARKRTEITRGDILPRDVSASVQPGGFIGAGLGGIAAARLFV